MSRGAILLALAAAWLLQPALLAQARAVHGVVAAPSPTRIGPAGFLTVPHLPANSEFGSAATISGDRKTVVVGAKGQGAGRLYVFVRPSSGWASTKGPAATLYEPRPRPGDDFGSSVAASADGRVIVSSAYTADTGEGFRVFVYKRGPSGWASTRHPAAILTRSGFGPKAGFGSSFAVSGDGDTALIGQYHGSSGALLLYERSKAGWQSSSKPSAVFGAKGDSLGSSVALSSDGRVAASKQVGSACPYVVAAANVRRQGSCLGGVEIFQRPAGGWEGKVPSSVDLAPSSRLGVSNLIGYSLGLSSAGHFLATGDCGSSATWLYSKASGRWSHKPFPHVRLSSPSPSCQNGQTYQTVALSGSGTRLVAGIDGARKVAYVYDRPSSGWHDSDGPDGILTVPKSRYDSGSPEMTPQFSVSHGGRVVIGGGVITGKVVLYRVSS